MTQIMNTNCTRPCTRTRTCTVSIPSKIDIYLSRKCASDYKNPGSTCAVRKYFRTFVRKYCRILPEIDTFEGTKVLKYFRTSVRKYISVRESTKVRKYLRTKQGTFVLSYESTFESTKVLSYILSKVQRCTKVPSQVETSYLLPSYIIYVRLSKVLRYVIKSTYEGTFGTFIKSTRVLSRVLSKVLSYFRTKVRKYFRTKVRKYFRIFVLQRTSVSYSYF